ncbi:MAG: hypothetical protein AB7V08_14380 [Elusimicrobiales bacterium]
MMRHFFQRHLNDLNLYCRFRDIGVSIPQAKRLSLALAKWMRPLLYGPVKAAGQNL